MHHLVDGRGMIPPEPLERALAVLPSMQAGDELVVLVYCHPVPLFEAMNEAGFQWRESVRADGTHEVVVSRRLS